MQINAVLACTELVIYEEYFGQLSLHAHNLVRVFPQAKCGRECLFVQSWNWTLQDLSTDEILDAPFEPKCRRSVH